MRKRWSVVINGQETVEVEAASLALALKMGTEEYLETITGRNDRRDITSVLVTRLDRDPR